MENNNTNAHANNTNLIYIIIFVILGVIIGYLLGSSTLNTNNQGAQSISSDAGKEVSRQGGVKSDDDVSPRIADDVRQEINLNEEQKKRVYELFNSVDVSSENLTQYLIATLGEGSTGRYFCGDGFYFWQSSTNIIEPGIRCIWQPKPAVGAGND